jgi:hypothetical protein
MSSRGRPGPDRIDHLVLAKVAAGQRTLRPSCARRRRDRRFLDEPTIICLLIAYDGGTPAGFVTGVDCHGVWVLPTIRTARRWTPIRLLGRRDGRHRAGRLHHHATR